MDVTAGVKYGVLGKQRAKILAARLGGKIAWISSGLLLVLAFIVSTNALYGNARILEISFHPTAGSPEDLYLFELTYVDRRGLGAGEIKLMISGKNYTMERVTSGGEGFRYVCEIGLDPGNHTYKVQAEEAITGNVVKTEERPGPQVYEALYRPGFVLDHRAPERILAGTEHALFAKISYEKADAENSIYLSYTVEGEELLSYNRSGILGMKPVTESSDHYVAVLPGLRDGSIVTYGFIAHSDEGKLRILVEGNDTFRLCVCSEASLLDFLAAQQKKDAYFGPSLQGYSGLEWSYYAVATYRKLEIEPRLSDLIIFNTNRSFSAVIPACHYQAMILSLLGENAYSSRVAEDILLQQNDDGTFTQPKTGGYIPFEPTYHAVQALCLMGINFLEFGNATRWGRLVDLIEASGNRDGGYSEIYLTRLPEEETGSAEDDRDQHSNIPITFQAVETLVAMGRGVKEKNETARFIVSLQNPDGGFGFDRNLNSSDIRYTYQAVKTLKALNYTLSEGRVQRCIDYVTSLRRMDGGFADRTDWPTSRLESTYYAVEVLDLLNSVIDPEAQMTLDEYHLTKDRSSVLTDDLHVYTFLDQGPGAAFGAYDPPSLVGQLAKQAGIDLYGVKALATGAEYLKYLNTCSERINATTSFILSEENYQAYFQIEGLGGRTHVGQTIHSPRADPTYLPDRRRDASWEEYRKHLEEIHRTGGLVSYYPSIREFDIAVMDDSVRRSGYDMLNTYHFNGDMMRRMPYLEKYLEVLGVSAIADAHNSAWKERHKIWQLKTLFIAPNSTWEGFMEAVKLGRIVCAAGSTLYGSRANVKFVEERTREWSADNSHQLDTPPDVLILPITKGNWYDDLYRLDADPFNLRDRQLVGMVYSSHWVTSVTLDGRLIDSVYIEPSETETSFSGYTSFASPALSPGDHTLTCTYLEEGLVKAKTEPFFYRTEQET